MKGNYIMALRDKIKKLTSFCELAEGRKKGLLEDIMEKEIVWNNYDNASLGKDIVPVVTFAEYPDLFFFGGLAFRDIIKELDDRDLEELRSKGIRIILHKQEVKSDKRKTYTRIEVCE